MRTRGIANLGNTCSINSLLQCLMHSNHVYNFMSRNTSHDYGELSREMINFFMSYHSHHDGVIVPSALLRQLQLSVPLLNIQEQNDVSEVWMMLCDSMASACFNANHDDMQVALTTNNSYNQLVQQSVNTIKTWNKDTASEWLDMFQGIFICQTECPMCGKLSFTFEPFTVISVDISDPSLCGCLENVLRSETIEGWTCEACKNTCTTTKTMKFWKLPNVLCLCIKRFVYNNCQLVKNNAAIEIPVSFGIARDSVLGPWSLTRSVDFKYVFRGCSIHHGDLHGGHYSSLCLDNENRWLYCDDTNVAHCDPQACQKLLSESYFIVYELA